MDNMILRHKPVAPYFSATPEVIGIEITGRCPLRCRHCFNHSGPENQQELSLEQIQKILDEMLTWNVQHLRISGGEPTYHRQFKDIIAACQRRNITIAMNTNGVYSSTMLDYLKSAPIDLFMISIDGLIANNDAIRGKGVFKRALLSCQELKKAGKQVMLSFHVGAGNQGDVAGLIKEAANIHVDFKVAPIRPIGRAKDHLPNALIAPKDYLRVVQTVIDSRQQYPHINIVTDFDILDETLPASDCHKDPTKASCKAGRTMININYDGEIYPCAFFADEKKTFSAGNIHSISMTQAWQQSTIFTPFRIQQKSAQCQSCHHYQQHCYGGCPAIAYFATSKLDAHDPTCFAELVAPPEGELP